jgi:hypothetical protein
LHKISEALIKLELVIKEMVVKIKELEERIVTLEKRR